MTKILMNFVDTMSKGMFLSPKLLPLEQIGQILSVGRSGITHDYLVLEEALRKATMIAIMRRNEKKEEHADLP